MYSKIFLYLQLEQWIGTLPLSSLLGSCFVLPEGDQLVEVSRLHAQTLDDIADAFAYGLKKVLKESQHQLKTTLGSMDKKAKVAGSGESSKFKTFKMSTGSVPSYIEGLTGRIGV